jgi:hypothetical protein
MLSLAGYKPDIKLLSHKRGGLVMSFWETFRQAHHINQIYEGIEAFTEELSQFFNGFNSLPAERRADSVRENLQDYAKHAKGHISRQLRTLHHNVMRNGGTSSEVLAQVVGLRLLTEHLAEACLKFSRYFNIEGTLPVTTRPVFEIASGITLAQCVEYLIEMNDKLLKEVEDGALAISKAEHQRSDALRYAVIAALGTVFSLAQIEITTYHQIEQYLGVSGNTLFGGSEVPGGLRSGSAHFDSSEHSAFL